MNVLATECELRETDATGFAFNSGGKLRIYKRPVAAHEISLKLSEDAYVIFGHTRMATQGDCKKNYNNHPFYGEVKNAKFALAHNGIIYNDFKLQSEMKLPKSRIETDSYVAVQLLEESGELSEKSLAKMAEKINCPFVFTVLDERNNSYFIKGDNPHALYHFADEFYVYAGTETILESALQMLGLDKLPYQEIDSTCGDILKIDSDGRVSRSRFQPTIVRSHYCCPPLRNRFSCYDIPKNTLILCSIMAIHLKRRKFYAYKCRNYVLHTGCSVARVGNSCRKCCQFRGCFTAVRA